MNNLLASGKTSRSNSGPDRAYSWVLNGRLKEDCHNSQCCQRSEFNPTGQVELRRCAPKARQGEILVDSAVFIDAFVGIFLLRVLIFLCAPVGPGHVGSSLLACSTCISSVPNG